ncbi:membrane protein YqaA with SNARE-associated domain [Paucimonas lemoignei]|uniref:Membrane protein YqaA with SNARE-associated domain n=1 Tax=Paucimonas lemoignei TaxID=29443 RepID=A0A4R3HV85_PAULE|nr:YqaA family protein [Paucimonas lemoignei]TCS36998.1 membrane protein YqaA with SNARE-associated domain [Paucimonas lemoignei]
MIESAVEWLLGVLAVPEVGLVAVFVVAFLSATLLPLGSEPTLFAVIKANENLFGEAIAIATIANTLGGMVNYWMGYGARKTFARERSTRWFGWLERFGPKTLLLAWVPGIGDALCVVAGWMQLPSWSCALYMAIGKFVRYVCITIILLHVPDGWWHGLADLLG